MKNIQISMGEVESLNERIYSLQEDLKESESQKKTLISQKRAKKIKKLIFFILGVAFLIFAFVRNVEGVAVLCLIFAGILGMCVFLLRNLRETKENESLDRVEKEILIKQEVLNEYKEKKKELIFENERKLNDALKEKITTNYCYEELYEEMECPMCAEIVKAKARICRYCGYKFE